MAKEARKRQNTEKLKHGATNVKQNTQQTHEKDLKTLKLRFKKDSKMIQLKVVNV